jgi:hypothetical protein
LVDNELEHKAIFIVSGTHLVHAHDLKVRMENLFRQRFPLTDVSYLFIDEADYFEPSVTTELEHAITRYEEKSNCTPIMVSTPNAPGGLFQKIELDPLPKYHKIILDYTVGLG